MMRRLFSTSRNLQSSAQEACAELLSRFGNKPISVRRQLFDANQVQLLSLTLARPNLHKNVSVEKEAPVEGTAIPPGYHLVYFTPGQLENVLGSDGTDRTVNPLLPFTRRMWAGGELEWNQSPERLLRVGQTVQETTKISGAEAKRLRDGGEMIVVGVEKTFENEKGIALVDRRNWVFQKEIGIGERREPAARPAEKPFPHCQYTRDFLQTEVSLFRFSALTFNGHKIHYSPEWCREVEGHRDCVVHGPLNLINMLDLWRDVVHDAAEEAMPKSITYRALSPLYVGEQYRIALQRDQGEGKTWKAEVWDSFGKQGMKGDIVG
ncbi:hypothetical protein P154DRAFT_475620, partial [Amniculicola lignicola CBS 123094]